MDWIQGTTDRHSKHRTCGYSLLELVIASASAAVLAGGLASSLYVASRSLDVSNGKAAQTRVAQKVLATITRDLQSALSLTELTSTSVTMTVPDRNGDTVPETIRYHWSGSSNAPLVQTYNGVAANLATDVQSFSLQSITRLVEGTTSLPIILFVSDQAPDGGGGLSTPSAAEQDRIDIMEGWGYDVTVISDQASQSEFDAEFANATVVYVSGDCNPNTIGTKLNDATIGVVTESFVNAENLGFYDSLSSFNSNATEIDIINTTHYLTDGISAGALTVATSSQELKWTTSTLAPDAITLANVSIGLPNPTLLILDAGDELADGNNAAGRRCQLPWGESSFDVGTLNADGLTIMQRALEFAAGAGDDTETPLSGVVFEEFTEAQEGSDTTSISINTPPGTANGDLLIAAVAVDGNRASSLSAPAGWTAVSVGANENGRVTFGVWWKISSGVESPQQQFTWSGNEEAYGWISRFTGHDPVSPVHYDAGTLTGDSSNSPICQKLLTPVDNMLVMRLGGFDDDDITIGDPGLSGHTRINMGKSGTGSRSVSGGSGYFIQATADDTGFSYFSLMANEQFRTVTLGINPASSP